MPVYTVWSTVGRDHWVGEEGLCLSAAKARQVIPQSMIAGEHYFAPHYGNNLPGYEVRGAVHRTSYALGLNPNTVFKADDAPVRRVLASHITYSEGV
jgi:hypothetical protein